MPLPFLNECTCRTLFHRRPAASGILAVAILGLALVSRPASANEPAAWNVRDHVPLDEVVIQCHRGAGVLEAENTIEAFQLAWKLGTIPESDVRTTEDGVIVAFHDDTFKRLVKEAGPELQKQGIEDLTWKELQQLDVGSWKGEQFAGRHVPRMADVFRLLAGHPERRIYLDIKQVDLEKLAAEIKAAGIGGQVILASTHYDLIRQWKTLVPESGTLLWMGGTEDELAKRLANLEKTKFADITQLQIHVHPQPADEGGGFSPSPEFLKQTGKTLRAHEIVFQTLPWGSTDPKFYQRLLDLGVASFATDYPKKTLGAVRDYYKEE